MKFEGTGVDILASNAIGIGGAATTAGMLVEVAGTSPVTGGYPPIKLGLFVGAAS